MFPRYPRSVHLSVQRSRIMSDILEEALAAEDWPQVERLSLIFATPEVASHVGATVPEKHHGIPLYYPFLHVRNYVFDPDNIFDPDIEDDPFERNPFLEDEPFRE